MQGMCEASRNLCGYLLKWGSKSNRHKDLNSAQGSGPRVLAGNAAWLRPSYPLVKHRAENPVMPSSDFDLQNYQLINGQCAKLLKLWLLCSNSILFKSFLSMVQQFLAYQYIMQILHSLTFGLLFKAIARKLNSELNSTRGRGQ